MPDIPAGTIGAFNTADPPGKSFSVLYNPIQPTHANRDNSIPISSSSNTTAPGCTFATAPSSSITDFAWLPGTDVYGNSVSPTGAYKPVTLTGGDIAITGNTTTDWTNAHNAALNATDDAAYRARTNATLPVYVFTLGFTSSVDDVLLQRMANDPSWLTAPVCTSSGSCSNYTTQPQGKYVFAANTQELIQAFMSLSSQALRLSK
jgi:hypothetical protein